MSIIIPSIVLEKLYELNYIESSDDFVFHHVSEYENGFSCFLDYSFESDKTTCSITVDSKKQVCYIDTFPRNVDKTIAIKLFS